MLDDAGDDLALKTSDIRILFKRLWRYFKKEWKILRRLYKIWIKIKIIKKYKF